jgi:hypothetical protein
MKLSLLLFLLSSKLKKAVKKHSKFRERVKEKNFTIVIKTKDGKRVRFFTFSDGAVVSGRRDVKASVSFVWDNPGLAFTAMASGKPDLTLKALAEGQLMIEGDATLGIWFGETVERMMKLK